MGRIIKKERLTEDTVSFMVEAPKIANSALPGQFIIAMKDDDSERIPLTICDWDKKSGTIRLVIQSIGYSSKMLTELKEGDTIKHLAGPLGKPSELIFEDTEKIKGEKILFVTGGVGTAPVYPQVKELSSRGIEPYVIIGARRKNLIILENEFRALTSNIFICTDSGDYGFHGMVTDMLEHLVKNESLKFDRAIVIGPMIMMKFTSLLTKRLGIPTTVSLNPIMVDGTGMCGACRVNVGGKTFFACVDGPEFDGHLVDYDECLKRLRAYNEYEAHRCKLLEGEKDGQI